MTSKLIYVVSDSTGATAERVVRAALLQFPDKRVKVRLASRIRDQNSVEEVIKRAREQEAMVVFTLVRPDLREQCHKSASKHGVETVDVIGALIHKVGTFLEANQLFFLANLQPEFQ